VRVLTDMRLAWGGTCGSGVWASSSALVEWLGADAGRLDLVRGRSIVELGAGVGFAGQSLLLLGASRVLLTDRPAQLPLLRENCKANGSGAECCAFLWGTRPREARVVFRRAWDLVVACDVVYDKRHVGALAQSLHALLGKGTRALLALPSRTDFGYRRGAGRGAPFRCAVEWAQPLPDYLALLDALGARARGAGRQVAVEVLDTAEVYADGTSVDIVLCYHLMDAAAGAGTIQSGPGGWSGCSSSDHVG
jgi:hypothetical protein